MLKAVGDILKYFFTGKLWINRNKSFRKYLNCLYQGRFYKTPNCYLCGSHGQRTSLFFSKQLSITLYLWPDHVGVGVHLNRQLLMTSKILSGLMAYNRWTTATAWMSSLLEALLRMMLVLVVYAAAVDAVVWLIEFTVTAAHLVSLP